MMPYFEGFSWTRNNHRQNNELFILHIYLFILRIIKQFALEKLVEKIHKLNKNDFKMRFSSVICFFEPPH